MVHSLETIPKGRREHVLLAKSSGRRGRARGAYPVAASGGAAGDLHTRPTTAQDLPHGERSATMKERERERKTLVGREYGVLRDR